MPDYLAIAAAWVAARVPYLGYTDLVSFDGTFYITQAREILSGNPGAGGAFPPGYPIAVALTHAFIGDGVRAAQVVSLLASLVATGAVYLLARRIMSRPVAVLCAVVFATTPLVVRSSMATMSESLYLACLLTGLLLYARGHMARTAVALGAAAITRPEALAIWLAIVVYDAVRFRHAARWRRLTLPFLAVYSLGVVFPLLAGGPLTLIPKLEQFGQGAAGPGRTAAPGAGAVLVHYLSRIPGDIALLFSHTGGLLLIVAAAGMIRHPGYVLFALIPLLVNPAFTPRADARFVLPFVPVVCLYAFVATRSLTTAPARRGLVAALVVFAAATFWFHRGYLTTPESDGFGAARDAGRELRERIGAGSIVADRKPFVAFYAGGRYLEIPPGSYDATIDTLFALEADYLSLMTGVTDFFRPNLEPLLYNEAAARGETRLEQVYADATGLSVFALTPAAGPPQPTTLMQAAEFERVSSPRWHSDGARVVYASNRRSAGAVCIVDSAGGRVDTLAVLSGLVTTVSLSPDGRRIALSTTEGGRPDLLLLDVESGDTSSLVRSNARDVDPDWDGNDTVIFASEFGRHMNLYRVAVDGEHAAERILTGDGSRRPRVWRGGDRLGWVQNGGARVADKAGRGARWAAALAAVTSAPAWSPDGRFAAVSSRSAGSDDIYLFDVETQAAVRVTTDSQRDESQPDWHPASNALVFVIDQRHLAVIDRLDPWLERLGSGYTPRTYGKAAGSPPGGP